MKKYIKDGKIKTRNQIVIKKNGKQYINPKHEDLIADGWEEYVIPELTDTQKLDRAKENKKREIEHYDSSSEVNEFTINGINVWLDKATRAGLKLRFEAEIAVGNTDTILWYNNTKFPLSLDSAIQMLYLIEIYASACYDNTQAHLANIELLNTISDIEAYDYTTGYPTKLAF